MIRKTLLTLVVLTLFALNAAQPALAQEREPEPTANTTTGSAAQEDERDIAIDDPDGSDEGHWELECWEVPDDDIIYCADFWIEDVQGDWDGDGSVDGSDF